MSKSAVIQTRIDPELKNKAQIIFNKLNISMSEAISIFLTQVTLKRGIPFDITLPNELTADTLKKSEDGRDLHKVSSVNQLFKELDR
jgi:DNA-damage-inducible protein J